MLGRIDRIIVNKRFCYYVHGFTLHSEIECAELLPGPCEASDVKIQLGCLDHIPLDEKHPGRSRCIGERHMFLNVDGVGKFSVRDGREVIVSPAPGTDLNAVRQYLFGSVFGCLIHQRGLLSLHANAFLHEDEAVLVLAHSGTGKSTLAASMRNRGCKILADDVCAVKTGREESIVYPGVPQIKLWRDAAERLGEDIGSMRKLATDEEKYAMPVLEPYYGQSLRIKALYILNVHDGNELEIVEPGSMEMFEALKNYTYRKGMVTKMGIQSTHLKSCAELERSVRIRRIYRPRGRFLLDELVDLIETDLQ